MFMIELGGEALAEPVERHTSDRFAHQRHLADVVEAHASPQNLQRSQYLHGRTTATRKQNRKHVDHRVVTYLEHAC